MASTKKSCLAVGQTDRHKGMNEKLGGDGFQMGGGGGGGGRLEAPTEGAGQGGGDADDGTGRIIDRAADAGEHEAAGALGLREKEQIGRAAGGHAGDFAAGGADGNIDLRHTVPAGEELFDAGDSAIRMEGLRDDGLREQCALMDGGNGS